MTWLWLALGAYWIGHVISVLEMQANHPDWHLLPCGVLGLAWPYLVVLRCIALFRRNRPSQW